MDSGSFTLHFVAAADRIA